MEFDIIMSDNDNPTIDEIAPFLGKYKSRLFYKYNADLECNILHITINTLEELVELTKIVRQSLILSNDGDTNNIEIYNTWRE